MARLAGRTVIITGAARGIGASYARAAATEGARVVVWDVLDPAETVAAVRATGAEAMGAVCDVTDAAAVAAEVARVRDRFGAIDGLVNNAAIFASLAPRRFDELTSEEFDRVMQINVRGTFECIKAVLPAMRGHGYGKIVNVASGTVFKGTPGLLHYTASKGAVVAMTRVVARELGEDGICVNCIAPGFTLSEGLEGADFVEETSRQIVPTRCFRRDMAPEDLNGIVVFLLASDSDFMTGQTVVVDGGSAMH